MTSQCQECAEPHYAKGRCRKHYRKWRRANFPVGHRVKRGETLIARFEAGVLKGDPQECWPWQRVKVRGYGQISNGAGVGLVAHRLAYTLMIGPIPEGHTLDHECHNQAYAAGLCAGGESCPHRACCNPAHLIPRLPFDNWLRGGGPAALIHG